MVNYLEAQFDHVVNRVIVSGAIGGLVGSFIAMSRGHFVLRNAALTGLSCAMVGTVCSAIERIVGVALENTMDEYMTRFQRLLTSHALAGAAGGAGLGQIYQKRPLNGMILLVPLMLCIGYGENLILNKKDEKLIELQEEQAVQYLLEKWRKEAQEREMKDAEDALERAKLQKARSWWKFW